MITVWSKRVMLQAGLMAAALRDVGSEPAVLLVTDAQLDRMGATLEQVQAMTRECISVPVRVVLSEPIPTTTHLIQHINSLQDCNVCLARITERPANDWRNKKPHHR